MEQNERITRALDLEQRRLAERDGTLRREAHDQSVRARDDFASRGLGISGMAIGALLDIQVERIRQLALAAAEIRREMCRTIPELASPEQLTALRSRLDTIVDAQWGHLAGALRQYGYHDDVSRILGSAQYDSKTLSLKSGVARALNNIADEHALGMSGAETRPITINITGNVGGVNFGTIAGDMSSTVTALEGEQGQALARAIKQVTEAVAADSSIGPEERAETVETMAAITEEAARPPERRRSHLVRTMIDQVGPLILRIPDMVNAWNTIVQWFGPKLPGT